eukprot:3932099-Rhodomonas_salina.1
MTKSSLILIAGWIESVVKIVCLQCRAREQRLRHSWLEKRRTESRLEKCRTKSRSSVQRQVSQSDVWTSAKTQVLSTQ